LTEKSKNTSIKQKEREQATQELQQLDKDFEAVHFSCVALDLQKPVVEMMKHIVECAIDEEKIVGRRHVKCASQALFAIDEYLAKA
jgi:hypothetical protein